jgi:UDP-N-acetylglucosamine 2-epimerase (non-hydrolysing)
MTEKSARRIVTIFGTRPEVIKLAPVIHELQKRSREFQTITVASGQHTDLLMPFEQLFELPVHHRLNVLQTGQSLNALVGRMIAALDPILEKETPDLVLVQGDTSTALAGALAAFHRRIPVGHVEAGLRSGDPSRPFPEEMNRRLITRLATWHFAATPRNRRNLLAEGIDRGSIAVTGNPVVDALKWILHRHQRSERLTDLLRQTHAKRRLIVTTHRRENLGHEMSANLQVLQEFVAEHPDVALIFPVHPNPAVQQIATKVLAGHERVWLTEPLDYLDFIGLLSESWLIASDSGGIQEEAPTLGKPLLVLRDVTERPEAIECGIAKLVGGSPQRLRAALNEAYWATENSYHAVPNPFGQGDSGPRIVQAIADFLRLPTPLPDGFDLGSKMGVARPNASPSVVPK